MDELVSELGERVVLFLCCFSEWEDVDVFFCKFEEVLGGLYIIVSNVGVICDNIMMCLKDEDWDDLFEINLIVYFCLVWVVLWGMMK